MNGFLGNLVSAINSKSKVEPRLATAFESPETAVFEPSQTAYEQIPDPAPVKKKTHNKFFEQTPGPAAENDFLNSPPFTEPQPGTVEDHIIHTEKVQEADGLYPKTTGTILQPIMNIKKEAPVTPVFSPDILGNTTENAGLLIPAKNKEYFYFQEPDKEAFVAGSRVINGNFTNNQTQQAATAFSLNNTFNAFLSSENLTEINNHLERASPVPPVVKISIGRIDIKAVPQTPPVRETKKQTAAVSLDDLLKKKNK